MTGNIQDKLLTLRELIAKPLSTDPATLRSQTNELGAWLGWIGTHITELERDLAAEKEENLPEKTKDLTELDRQIKLDAAVRNTAYTLNALKRYEKAVYTLISLSQSEQKMISEQLKRMTD